ncbi:AFL080Wp [Eremothecium gossypii ATCC 10895]|uniref:ATP-dependent RNA helicase DBP3 n=1 Tax=Eremothecium gossypii (strain ATCC 10895 / CBS 109.51 / FGSC 9923 / NRRL Y-1056) TaxID=284811 RepID=DBP3_EREGS|nr:AFL080Wp [Eremothecium gossypii ATCC 10895]Q755A5.1 RecName: Full=ATP-dependent RNA helicase DBP3 [Eremothecium gossypii ATCC 10895]AAS53292.1 AFL080Wp [Eremothecium gossypii ATCC 10895]AEY97602.1 FAFL080Wp [Eremothecium gossypii FDAG1]
MSKHELKDKKRKSVDGEDVSKSKKVKKDKKDKKDKKAKDGNDKVKDKKDKNKKDKSKTDKNLKEVQETEAHTGSETAPVGDSTAAAGYVESKELASVPQADVDTFFSENEVAVEDPESLGFRPLLSFSHLNLHSAIQKEISKFPKPTPIQAVSWPYLLAGKDVIGVAETGSGKTFAFGVPAINSLMSEKSTPRGVKCLVISPTRELASQIYDNLVQLTDKVGLNCCCVYGGVQKDSQREQLKKAQVVVATPGRLLDLIEEGSAKLAGVQYLVLDEADRMLEKGFEEDIKRIIKETKSDVRQTLMFTATWPKEVRELASTFMRAPVKVSIGNRDELSANKRITQVVEVIDPFKKEKRLLELLKQYQSGAKKNDKVLIFALYKKEASRVERNLKYNGYNVAAIHGDLSQQQRTQALSEFKAGTANLLLATDVAARGLDIPNVKTVINLTFPLTVEDYVHRIGRTGRAGATGVAHTLFTEQEKHLAGALVNVLNGAGQPVPEELMKFGTHTKRKEHNAYGAFYKNVDLTKKAKKITFD